MNLYNFFLRLLAVALFLIFTVIKNASAQMVFDNRGNSHLTETLKGNIGDTDHIVLVGKVMDDNNNPVAYASIGISSADCGTVADRDGNFYLKVDKNLLSKTVTVSALGFKARELAIKGLVTILSYNSIITLTKELHQLQEVVITAKKIHIRTIGSTSRSSIGVGFPLKSLGSELGVKLSLGKKMVWFRSFNFNIPQTRLDTCTFRLNIYALKNGDPAENLLTQNILVGVGKVPGAYKIDLTPYKLLMQGDVLVSLEWIAGKSAANIGAVFFSASLLSSCYHRSTTAADWTHVRGVGAGFNLQVADSE